MQSGQTTLYNLFDGTKIFVIPAYQRSYAWGKKQLEDFTSDFENQVLDKDYFFGTILFREASKEDPFEIIEIVDGQQRITTLIIYVRLILGRLKDAGEDVDLLSNAYVRYGGRNKLKVQPEDNVFFESYILKELDGSNMIRTPAQGRLWTASQFLQERVNTYTIEQMREIRKKIDRTRVLIYSVQDKSEATLIFEVTNDRGKPLTNLEKTKAFLMHKTYLASPDPEPELETIQQSFVDIFHDLEPILEKQKNVFEDSILQYHFIAFEKWWSNNQTKQYADYVGRVKNKIDGIFKKPDFPATTAYIQNYTRELRESYKISRNLIVNPEKNFILDLIALNRPANFYPLLIKTYKLDTSDTKREYQRVTRLMEIISFRVWGVRRRRSTTGRETLYALARDFKGDFPRLIEQIKNFIENYANDNEFQSKLLNPMLYKSIGPNDLRYLYWKYENYLRLKETPIFGEMSYEEFRSNDPQTKLSIEHIAPQHPEELKVIIDNSILPDMNKEFQEQWLHSIGNLTIDPSSSNSSKSNIKFESKNQKYFRKAPYKTQNELIDFVDLPHPRWDESVIRKRRDKILDFALKYWNYRDI
ncbi:DUF262 domain-containing protein [Chloroflexota bacterium]